uniref:RBD domain-containing protein n=1 Tax=Trichuris muris TaxID=70415 RepID=A0A5S6QS18_TRIMR
MKMEIINGKKITTNINVNALFILLIKEASSLQVPMPCRTIVSRAVRFDAKPTMDVNCNRSSVVAGLRKRLRIVLPDETVKDVLVDPQVPMMDLLVRTCTEFNFNPVEMTLNVPTDIYPGYLQYKPSAAIGTLKCDVIKLVPKFYVEKNMHSRNLKEINELAANDLCATVDLPGQPSVALRAQHGCTVAKLLEVVCNNARLSPVNDYCLCPKDEPRAPLPGDQLLAGLSLKRFKLMRTDESHSSNLPCRELEKCNKVVKRRAPLPPSKGEENFDLGQVNVQQASGRRGRCLAPKRSDSAFTSNKQCNIDAKIKKHPEVGECSPISFAKEEVKESSAGSLMVQKKKNKAPSPPTAAKVYDGSTDQRDDGDFTIESEKRQHSSASVVSSTGLSTVAEDKLNEAAVRDCPLMTQSVEESCSKSGSSFEETFHLNTPMGTLSDAATDDTKSVVLTSDETVLSSPTDDATLFVDQRLSKDDSLQINLIPQSSAASFSRDLVPSDVLVGESDKSLSETTINLQKQFTCKTSTLPPLHILLDFKDESSCVLSDSCLPSANAEMTNASLPVSPMSNIRLRDPNEEQYPRMVVKNFEEEYYSTQRTDDYLNFIRFGYRGEASKSPERRRRQSMPTQGNAWINSIPNRRHGCIRNYGKPVGPAATISRFGVKGPDGRPPLFRMPIMDDLEREYKKLQSIFSAWHLCLKSDSENRMGDDNNANLQAQNLQRAILSQQQLLRGICERILQLSPVSFEQAGGPTFPMYWSK